MGEQVIQRGIEEAGVEMELLLVFGAQGRIGVDDADKLSIVLEWEGMQEARDMAVLEADDGDPNGPLLPRSWQSKSSEKGGNGEDGDENGRQGTSEDPPGTHDRYVTAAAAVAPVLCRMVP